jgi:hypothetical protein
VSEYEKAFRLSRLAGEAPAGPFEQAAKRVDLQNLEHWIVRARTAGCVSLDKWREVRVGRGDEFARADRIVGELSIPVRLEVRGGATQIRTVKIHGSLGFISPRGDASVRLVLRDKAKVKDFLGPFVTAMVLAASGELNGKNFDAIVVGARKNEPFHNIRSLRCPPAEQARDYLSYLLSDLLFAKNHYFLPIEAVEKVAKEGERGSREDLLDLIYDVRDNEFARCSSDYGPIRDGRRFEPPTIGALKKIMERRFELIRAIFDKGKD